MAAGGDFARRNWDAMRATNVRNGRWGFLVLEVAKVAMVGSMLPLLPGEEGEAGSRLAGPGLAGSFVWRRRGVI